MTERIINVDMDGVVADFDAYVLKHLGRTFNHTAGPGEDQEMWDFLKTVPNLYAKLDLTPYAEKLMQTVHNSGLTYRFLTAIPRRTTMPTAQEDKIVWAEKYFPGVKVCFGPYSRDKWKWAKAGDILIDDRADNIDDWITKGKGIGILHKYDDVTSTLEKFLDAKWAHLA